jgi:hypothetical protein
VSGTVPRLERTVSTVNGRATGVSLDPALAAYLPHEHEELLALVFRRRRRHVPREQESSQSSARPDSPATIDERSQDGSE